MEAKLQEYRARRRRKELLENVKQTVSASKDKIADIIIPKFFKNMMKEKTEEEVLLIEDEVENTSPLIYESDPVDLTTEISVEEALEEPTPEQWRKSLIRWSLYFVTWLTLYIFFLQLQFGAVFFVVSLLIGICLNTRTRPKKKGEVSAYSVFNENCTSIDGTLKAEQLQRQLLYGPVGLL